VQADRDAAARAAQASGTRSSRTRGSRTRQRSLGPALLGQRPDQPGGLAGLDLHLLLEPPPVGRFQDQRVRPRPEAPRGWPPGSGSSALLPVRRSSAARQAGCGPPGNPRPATATGVDAATSEAIWGAGSTAVFSAPDALWLARGDLPRLKRRGRRQRGCRRSRRQDHALELHRFAPRPASRSARRARGHRARLSTTEKGLNPSRAHLDAMFPAGRLRTNGGSGPEGRPSTIRSAGTRGRGCDDHLAGKRIALHPDRDRHAHHAQRNRQRGIRAAQRRGLGPGFRAATGFESAEPRRLRGATVRSVRDVEAALFGRRHRRVVHLHRRQLVRLARWRAPRHWRHAPGRSARGVRARAAALGTCLCALENRRAQRLVRRVSQLRDDHRRQLCAPRRIRTGRQPGPQAAFAPCRSRP